MAQLRSWTALATLPLLAAACSAEGEGTDGATIPGGNTAVITAQLQQASSCDALLQGIQDEALVALERIADQARTVNQGGGVGRGPAAGPVGVVTPNTGIPVMGTPGAVALDPSAPVPQDSVAPPGAAPAPPAATTPTTTTPDDGAVVDTGAVAGNAAAEAPSGTTPREFSETNNQVVGVDEADIVKTDGNNLYVLHGAELFVVDVTERASMLVGSQTVIEGQPLEMFVKDGRAVVFSNVEPTVELLGSQEALNALYQTGYSPYTKLTVLDVADASVEPLREIYTQGYYLAARRIDDRVRGVVTGGQSNVNLGYPNIEYYDLFGDLYEQAVIDEQIDAWLERRGADVLQTTLEDWLPVQRERVGGQVQVVERDCTSYYLPAAGLTQPGATTVVSLDLADVAGSAAGTTILGNADVVYSNSDTLVLSQRDYRFLLEEDAREQSAVHRFSLADGDTLYQGSGFVPGHVLNQFSIDEVGGVIRLATTENVLELQVDPNFPEFSFFNQTPENRVYTLGLQADSTLAELGRSELLGKPGETIFSARFIGDKGYIVTFLRRDPLVVMDLSVPESPTVLGQLDIPGFSNYLQPLGDTHLLALGRDVDPVSNQDLGFALQIFDVSDASMPQLAHKTSLSGYSIAESEQRAFNYYAPLGMLTFPFISYDNGYRSSMEVFRVDAVAGFEFLASIDHSGAFNAGCVEELSIAFGTEALCAQDPVNCQFYQQDVVNQCLYRVGEVRRGVFIEDLLYSISTGGILAHSTVDFAQTAALDLPEPSFFGGGIIDIGFAQPGSTTPTVVAVPPSAISTPVPEMMPAAMTAGTGSAGASSTEAAPAEGTATGEMEATAAADPGVQQ